MTKAPFTGKTGSNPANQGKGGDKRSLLTEAHCTPLAVVIDGINRHDMRLVKRTLPESRLRSAEADIGTAAKTSPEIKVMTARAGGPVRLYSAYLDSR
jgi:hypothetical protein